MQDSTVLLAGGGTAGHVNPLIATAKELAGRGVRVYAVGTEDGLEAQLVPAAGFELRTIDRVPFPRRLNAYAVAFPRRFRKAVAQARMLIDELHASAVVGFGGFASTPLYIGAHRASIPIIVHEANARPGLANKVGARWADVVALTFSSTRLRAHHGRTIVTGLPLRPAIAELAERRRHDAQAARSEAAQLFGLDPALPTLLVTGGSLGAQRINEAMIAAMPDMRDIQVLHISGKGKDDPVRQAARAAGASHYVVRDYVSDMEHAFAAADLVVARSGAGTVAEVSALSLPAVFVPLAIGNGEQALNAADSVAAGAAVLIHNSDFSAQTVRTTVLPLLESSQTRGEMSRAASRLVPHHSAAALAEAIMTRIGNE
ncbi:MAG: undecaprenyldiphospho-muramoylpentapeptide beta-N-acetylglucosaminyltransferase [Actinomycetaceae bacterium]|nr:undecaprenyldiphospho-muramoylpentapeptide beta-N-acetylglucosaminyltransferase [Actinomycetaceae bacterium]MDY6083037.1 undecaprenyldiphospho-muramoylpentapeptide beta-N-acetylglucosaminyltransferase [Actinomycetaceae bacterium]